MTDSPTTSPALKRVDVYASLESQAQLRALDLPAALHFPESGVSLETQQMDEAKRVEELARYNDSLKKLLQAEKPTGTPQLFVLDPLKVAHSDPEARSTLRALASAQFSRKTPVAVALLPAQDPADAPLVEATGELLKAELLKDYDVTLEGVDALREWLQSV